jgi:hypothetical protein
MKNNLAGTPNIFMRERQMMSRLTWRPKCYGYMLPIHPPVQSARQSCSYGIGVAKSL